ncbi:MAG: hypothetical protein HWE30_16495 [Methylocystaceae bacterium]|nr:hypothetical protein [Methylocystaceae bacterium]
MIRQVALFLAIGLTQLACSYGATEFQIYDQAFETQYLESAKVMDRLGQAERTIVRRLPDRQLVTRDFDPDEAAYVLDVGDPPLTGAVRVSLDALKAYNDALSGLVTGDSAAAMAAELGLVSGNLENSINALTSVTGVALGYGSGLAQAMAQVLPVFQLAQTARSRQEFRRQLVAAHPHMRALLLEMRAGTLQMFAVMRRSREGRRVLGSGGSSFSAEALQGLESDRKLLAGWVILLDKTLVTMETAVAAVEAGAGSAGLSDLLAATVDLKATAQAIEAARQ